MPGLRNQGRRSSTFGAGHAGALPSAGRHQRRVSGLGRRATAPRAPGSLSDADSGDLWAMPHADVGHRGPSGAETQVPRLRDRIARPSHGQADGAQRAGETAKRCRGDLRALQRPGTAAARLRGLPNPFPCDLSALPHAVARHTGPGGRQDGLPRLPDDDHHPPAAREVAGDRPDGGRGVELHLQPADPPSGVSTDLRVCLDQRLGRAGDAPPKV